MLQMDDGLRCIDFEFSCVTNAIQDVSYVVGWIQEDTYRPQGAPEIEDKQEKKRAFLGSYLRGIGAPNNQKDIDDLLLDAEISWLAHSIHNNRVRPWNIQWDKDSFQKEWEVAKESVKLVFEREGVRRRVLERGFGEVHNGLRSDREAYLKEIQEEERERKERDIKEEKGKGEKEER
uniref:Uncharacterized protein n=2 Tax=Paramoeba aestuarina TaxID=180227 RepID=A0A7S4PIX2_9EUKA|mmetsp:Transcript_7222/g.10894  ORF Transcript_7222/g.10894 Transcript_7222/m.10894 type:complete len:177 (+) Transcript_7222:313-843(+)